MIDRAARARRVLACRAMLGDQFTIDAAVACTRLDVAAITDALRLYEVEDDEAESASMEAAEADADADADAGDEAR